ncbi:glucose-inhibited division protein A [Verrucomicrobiaceae bacterium SCGC AG-212-N21]|nr:glucose-inhibited division protein A [Verrucomicrobiaceae bacterium SCGC AG-212-N21]
MNRRHFFSASLAAAGVSAVNPAGAADTPSAKPGAFTEPARDLVLVNDVDVIVCGAGPAGVAAAISAARAGAKVRLFEWRGCLGGVWTAGLLGYLLDFNKPGFARELLVRLQERGLRRGTSMSSICYEPEGMKLLLEELCVEAGVKFQLHTRVAAAFREGRRLTTVVTESKSGRQAWRAPVFIDTTGDGDLGALAGCEWEIGEAKDCPCQPMSLNALLVCKDAAALAPFIHGSDPTKADGLAKDAFKEEILRTGHFPSYAKPTLWQVRDDLLLVMMNHEYGIKPFDAAQVTEATVRARAELHKIVNGLRKLGGAWDGLQIAATAEQIGVRDGRRIAGRYTVTRDDVVNGARFDDAVVRPTFSVDIHALTAEHNKTAAYSNAGHKVKPYDIPLRAMIAKDVDGLMMAGRCISGDFIAHASYRVTGNAAAMGEAAGVVAAIAATSKRLPHEVSWAEAMPVMEKARPKV